jgi:pyruvate dehydrogenase E1 component
VADAGLLEFPHGVDGIGPLNAIYQARFMRYLENRGLIEKTPRKIWAFVGDGETDEVDTLGAISLGAREKLDNLIFVVNCNLQRLDGPVRGNKRIIDELEGRVPTGAGWNVIKVIWGGDWDPAVCARPRPGCCCAGWRSAWMATSRPTRQGRRVSAQHFFGKYPELLETGEGLYGRRVDPSASRRARSGEGVQRVQARDGVQGRANGSACKDGEGVRHGVAQSRNATHSEKKLTDEGLAAFVKRFEYSDSGGVGETGDAVPAAAGLARDGVHAAARSELGGYMPTRSLPSRSSRRRGWITSVSGRRDRMVAPCRPRWGSSRSCATC